MKRPEGRPPKIIDWPLLENLISIFCTGEECAAVLDVDYDTLNKYVQKQYKCSFSDYFKKANAKGRSSLRRRQFELTKNNTGMAIWLGKQYLGQKDDAIIDQSSHYHYTQIKDDDLIKQARERGVNLPDEIARRLGADSSAKPS